MENTAGCGTRLTIASSFGITRGIQSCGLLLPLRSPRAGQCPRAYVNGVAPQRASRPFLPPLPRVPRLFRVGIVPRLFRAGRGVEGEVAPITQTYGRSVRSSSASDPFPPALTLPRTAQSRGMLRYAWTPAPPISPLPFLRSAP